MSYEELSDQSEYNLRRKNDNAWREVFRGCHVLDQIDESGKCCLKAEELKRYGNREPRLMAKIESKYNIPSVLKEHKLCILPYEARGNYIIGHFDAFIDIDYSPGRCEPEPIHVEQIYDTLNPYSISKEPSAILSAFNYGILGRITGDHDTELRMTNFGRESTAEFEYRIGNVLGGEPYEIHVNGSQLEMDGVFESDDCIINIEAKIGTRDDFLARQLYYPYRLIENKTDKDILNVFLTYSGGSIFTHAYKIDEPDNYNSFRLVESRRFDFFEEISISEVSDIVRHVRITDEPVGIPFPQADSMQKIIDAMELINRYPFITDGDLAYKMAIDKRQGGYYSNACKYLGLIERVRTGSSYENCLSRKGKEILNMPLKMRMLEVIRLIARHDIFNHFLNEYLEQSSLPKREDVVDYLINNIDKMNSDSVTPNRRASTVISWIGWILDACSTER